jgi:hypothetical protein
MGVIVVQMEPQSQGKIEARGLRSKPAMVVLMRSTMNEADYSR